MEDLETIYYVWFMKYECTCPSCKQEIEIQVERWSTEDVCPKCEVPLEVEYDLMYDEESCDEWDFYEIKTKE